MPLLDMHLTVDDDPIPSEMAGFLREADRRIDVFQQSARLPGFVPSDYPRVYRILRSLACSDRAPGKLFCEWGSGFGVVACLARMLGYDAVGIEIDAELVTAAQLLAHDFELRVEFVRGSYIPRGAEGIAASAKGSQAWLDTGATGALFDPDAFDVIFAYPWPDENGVTEKMFEHYAAAGAILVTYHGNDPIRVRRRAGRRRRR